jgi:hypothetical protein
VLTDLVISSPKLVKSGWEELSVHLFIKSDLWSPFLYCTAGKAAGAGGKSSEQHTTRSVRLTPGAHADTSEQGNSTSECRE